MSRASPRPRPGSVFVTGANGYIGSAVCRAFARAGWRVYGLIRRPSSAPALALAEVTPVLGDLDSDLAWVDDLLAREPRLDVLVNCVESFPDYDALYERVINVLLRLARGGAADSNTKQAASAKKPLLLWTSGCKDYGLGGLDGVDVVPHTEETPLNPPAEPIRQRAETSQRIFEHAELLDAVLLRPTSVYGYSSSYYAALMDYAREQSEQNKSRSGETRENVLRFPGVDPRVPMHAMHVDDCAESYVALAEHADRAAVAGQVFNQSGYRYETGREVGEALARAYGFTGGASFATVGSDGELVPETEPHDWFPNIVGFTFKFPQWVASDKIRRLTGWTDRRALFTEDVETYRRSYEAEKDKRHENIGASLGRLREIGTLKVQ